MNLQSIFDKRLLNKIILCILPVLLISVILIIYAKSIDYKVIGGDDEKFTLLLNPQYTSKGIVKRIFSSNVFPDTAGSYYRPILTLSFYFDNKISGNNLSLPASHTINILLHIVSVLLFFRFLCRYYFDIYKSFIASLVFAVSPVISETVVWLPGRNDSILFIFILFSFMFFINCNENEKNKETHLTFHLMLYFMALLTKESAVVFPLLCFCYMVIKQYPEKLKFCLYWFVLTLVYLIIRNQITDLHYTWHYILNLKNLVINLNMVFDYFSSVFFISEIHTFTSVKILTFVKGILMIALLLFFAIRTSNRKICIFFFFWAIMFLLPNFFVERAHFQGNRMYVPMAGLIICAVMVVESIIKTRLQKYIFTTILVFFVSVSIVKTNHRIVNFQDAISFWHYEKTNNYTIWSAQQYAFALSNNGYYAEAMKEFEDLIYDRKIATKDIVLNYSLVCRLSGDIDKADRLLNDFNINSNAN